MFCTNCGRRLEDGDLFCYNCGQKVDYDDFEEEIPLHHYHDHGAEAPQHHGVETPQHHGAEIPPRRFDEPEVSHEVRHNIEYYGVTEQPEGQAKAIKYIEIAAGCIGLSWLLMFLLNLLNRLFWTLNSVTYLINPLSSAFGVLSSVFYYARAGLSWALIVISAAVIIGLIYLMTQRRSGTKQILVIGIVDAALVLLTAVLYNLPFFSTAYYVARTAIYVSGILSVILGLDLFLNVFVEKKGLSGTFNLGDDIALLKEKFSRTDTVDSTHYTDPMIPQYELTEEHESNDSYFDGKGSELLIKYLLLVLLSLLTCGLAAPIMLVNILTWKKEHTVIEGKRLIFNGTAGQLFALWIKWYLLGLITCGIYWYFAFVDYMKWVTKHTGYRGTQPVNGVFEGSVFDGNTAEALGNLILGSLLTTVTCGIALPWAMTMITRWEKKSTVIRGQRLFYDGDAGGIFGTFLIVYLLSLITCGIYLPWGACRMEKYIITHTHIDSRWNYMPPR